MEDQLIHLLANTQLPAEGPRKHAEQQLRSLYAAPGFALALTSIGSHDSVPVNIRQSALLSLKIFVLEAWSPQFDEFKGQVLVPDDEKLRIRQMLLTLAVSGTQDRKVKGAASYVVSKIANADFPEDWPDLLGTILQVIQTGAEDQLHGALKVLGDLVDECLNDVQFFRYARDLVKTVYDVAVNNNRKPIHRALAVNVFRVCFDILEMIMADNKDTVKVFADEALSAWMPFFMEVIKTQLPPPPSEEEENSRSETAQTYRGLVALKLQVIKVLMRIRTLFPSILAPQSPVLFSSIWEELSSLQAAYNRLFIEAQGQGRLVDNDGLPFSLDFLVLEELDFMQSCLRAAPVRKELENQLQQSQGTGSNWIVEVMKLVVGYSQITTEEEGLWNIDINVFLSEETSVTANFTPRTACGDLVIKLGEWLSVPTIEALLTYTRQLYSTPDNWKAKEAALYILSQLLGDYEHIQQHFTNEAAAACLEFAQYAIQQDDEFLRARGHILAGSLTMACPAAVGQVSSTFMQTSLQAINEDSSEVVQVSCIRTLQFYLQAVRSEITLSLQAAVIQALSNYIGAQDFADLAESEDLLVTMVETLRDAILLDKQVCLTGSGLDLLFTIASQSANNFNISCLVDETFEEVAEDLSKAGPDAYTQLCAKVLPSLMGVFDMGTLTEENALTNLAATLLSKLSKHGQEPLPNGFVATVMPKLNRILMEATDDELLKAATSCVRNILVHDYKQFFEWRNEQGKGGLEIALVIIDRLLGPSVDDNSAAEVGGLAAEVVEKAGAERLGPYLEQLLRAVAFRLGTATQAQFIQSLILVFARLSLVSAREVLDFLAGVQVGDQNGLQVVMSKWLENSVNFVGYDEIRQNVIALSKLYDLDDPRLSQIQVKGDLVINDSGRIVTRSQARRNPDHFTIVPANIKIIKVLVEELLHASGSRRDFNTADAVSEGSDENEEWEDDDDVLDLGLGTTKQGKFQASSVAHWRNGILSPSHAELMAFAEETPFANRQPDDETQAYLMQFFRNAAAKPGFGDIFNALSPAEQEKLQSFG
ncbi:ARM repeat-containing protein [Trichodelitschia bisporula]|uniref:ARM repeat-containing protein n=1 Tax=Trichodelitschia bisporula TaxID=703511 RepID=A0A6G1HZM1_9PEZI|nr:ARM repeat-containing protein [Trichodelitschia bisporula]